MEQGNNIYHINYRINEAGAYVTGHFRSLEIKLCLGNPHTCGCLAISQHEVKELLDILGIDWEDGVFLEKALVGQIVSVSLDENEMITAIGDPYGNDVVLLKK